MGHSLTWATRLPNTLDEDVIMDMGAQAVHGFLLVSHRLSPSVTTHCTKYI
jgi:hypothetical protein